MYQNLLMYCTLQHCVSMWLHLKLLVGWQTSSSFSSCYLRVSSRCLHFNQQQCCSQVRKLTLRAALESFVHLLHLNPWLEWHLWLEGLHSIPIIQAQLAIATEPSGYVDQSYNPRRFIWNRIERAKSYLIGMIRAEPAKKQWPSWGLKKRSQIDWHQLYGVLCHRPFNLTLAWGSMTSRR